MFSSAQAEIWEHQHFSEKSEGYLRQGPMERQYLYLNHKITADFVSALI